MFSHVMVGANDLDTSKRFYDAALGALGIPEGTRDDKGRVWYRTQRGTFAIATPIDGQAATNANGGTIGFYARTPDEVAAFHDAGAAAGGTSIEDPPGPREGPFGKLHLAYLRDPDGNKLCALHPVKADG